jgi:alanine dehydrogenase
MKIGIPKEIKTRENRISLTPAGCSVLTEKGHHILVEQNAGSGSGFSDSDFANAGASILQKADDVWQEADMIVKVKEPVDAEYTRMKDGQIVFTYLHLAADKTLTQTMLDTGVIGVAYETIQNEDGGLPLLAPMSEVAGRLAVQKGCFCLEKKNNGKGLLLSGVPGVEPGSVVIIGGGIAGLNAAQLAVGMGARVTILDIDLKRLRYLDQMFQSQVTTLISNQTNIELSVLQADLVIGTVLIPGAQAPKLIKKEYLSKMEPGSAFVDVAIDQGGCSETSRPTDHNNPTYVVDNIVHYCVTNMPGAVPRTSTFALTNATLPYVVDLADKGLKQAVKEDNSLAGGVSIYQGRLTCPQVAKAFDMEYSNVEDCL